MKLCRITLVTSILAILLVALPVFAQEATPAVTPESGLQTFTNDKGDASLQFPAGWVSKNGPDTDSLLTVNLANSNSVLDKDLFGQDSVFQSGEIHIQVAVISLPNLVSSLPVGTLTVDATPLDVVRALVKQGLPDTFTFSDPGATTIKDNPAVRMNLTAAKRGEGQLLLTIYDKTWVAALILYAAAGEGDKWDIIARDILSSITIAPTAEVTPRPDVEPTVEPPPSTQTYISQAGKFTVTFPTTWTFDDRSANSNDNVVGGVFSSNHDSQFKQLYADLFQTGDIHVELALADLAKLASLPRLAKITDTTPVTDVLQGLVEAKVVPELTFSKVVPSTFENATAAQADVSGAVKGDGRLILIKRLDGSFIFLVVYTASGELAAGDAAARLIANSIEFISATPIPESTLEPVPPLTQTTKTKNGLGTLSYPDTWFSRQYGDESIYIANTQAALDKSFGSVLESGQVNLLISMSTTDAYIKQAKLPANADATPLELLQLTIKAVGDAVKFGMPEATTIDGKPAAYVSFQAAGYEGVAWLIEYQKGATVAVQMLAAPGEANQWLTVAVSIATSIRSTD